ncbi:MAG: hypothetical protein LBC04_02935 [Holosporaceae bacterium]|nr:hypothetical protein [Holosporaceae bacterium]
MKYLTDSRFEKELRTLAKKFRSLPEDFEILKRFSIEFFHAADAKGSNSIFKIEGCCNDRFESYIIKKVACKSLKGKGCKSGIRITYVLDKHLNTVIFMEMYFKADKKIEDKERLKEFIERTREKA